MRACVCVECREVHLVTAAAERIKRKAQIFASESYIWKNWLWMMESSYLSCWQTVLWKREQLYSQMGKKTVWLSNTCWIMAELLILQLADWSPLHFFYTEFWCCLMLLRQLLLFHCTDTCKYLTLTLPHKYLRILLMWIWMYTVHIFPDSQMFLLQFIWREHVTTHKSGSN